MDEEEFYRQQKGLPNKQPSYNPFGYAPALASSNRKWARWVARFVLLLIPAFAILIIFSPRSEIDPNAYYESGNLKFDKKDYSGAIKDYTKALEISNDPVLFYSRGIAKLMSGDKKGGCIDLKKGSNVLTKEEKQEIKNLCN